MALLVAPRSPIPCSFPHTSIVLLLAWLLSGIAAALPNDGESPAVPDPSTTQLYYDHPAEAWKDALPVGNGRLGAMVFGRTEEERIQLNEDTLWSGGPYSQTVKGAHEALPEIRRLLFAGRYIEAHRLFGKRLMGYPVEQQKYQSLGDLVLTLPDDGEVTDYRNRLDLDRAVAETVFRRQGITFCREVFASAADPVIVIRITADRPGAVTFRAELRGCRNTAHSNYATDYFDMDGLGDDGLIVTGKSADYLGVEGKLRYEARLLARPTGGTMSVEGPYLRIEGADEAVLLMAAATNFIDYRTVGVDPRGRVEAHLATAREKSYEALLADHLEAHRALFRRVSVTLDDGMAATIPTDARLARFDGTNDPALAGLCFQFGRYLLITASRPGTQPANLQGIWNEDMNPSWDSKYTTNINTEMNYWPAEVGNLAECARPLFRMIEELTDQGRDVAREHYGARGWVFHQNTDLWRVAAPMDGPDWGAFTTGGVWLCTHLWEHYRYSGDREFLARYYPILKDCARFFLDFLVPHPRYGWLVTNPSTSPENFPGRPGNDPFFDEICSWMSPGTSLCTGSSIDMQLLYDFFGYVAEASRILERDGDFRNELLATRERLAPMRVGRMGNLMEWLEDWPEKEKSHRHISHLYGLFPGNRISPARTPELARACEAVLNQRGLQGNGWSSAWKMACWARLRNPEKALENFHYYTKHYTTKSLFAICSRAMQVDGALGMTAAVAEMLMQSHEGVIDLMPALPGAWPEGVIRGLRARGGFEVDLSWAEGKLTEAIIRSERGSSCRIRYDDRIVDLTLPAWEVRRLDGNLEIR